MRSCRSLSQAQSTTSPMTGGFIFFFFWKCVRRPFWLRVFVGEFKMVQTMRTRTCMRTRSSTRNLTSPVASLLCVLCARNVQCVLCKLCGCETATDVAVYLWKASGQTNVSLCTRTFGGGKGLVVLIRLCQPVGAVISKRCYLWVPLLCLHRREDERNRVFPPWGDWAAPFF